MFKTREDDARGAPKGHKGNPPFVATEEQRTRVRDLAKVFPLQGEKFIARLIGVSLSTLREHFREDMEMGRAQMLAAIGSQMISRAMNAGGVDANQNLIAKGDLDAQKFVLARLGGWSTRIEHSGPDGGPVQHANFDLSGLSPEDKRAALLAINAMLGTAGSVDGDDAT